MDSDVRNGQILAGKYRVEELLGRGGMGVVMAAVHLQLNQKVALKFLTKEACALPEAVERFLREARAAVQIQSEHVARVLDFGTLESGAPYIVMEYLRGMDMKDLARTRGPLPVAEAVDYMLQAIDAVAEAHALGIIHRDLKPSNLFVTQRADGSPLVKVLDFGISKAVQADASSQLQITATAAIMGSPQYMSPEQIRSSKNVDARADIWALGTILHELLAGAPAYTADTVPGLLAMIVADPPPSLSSVRPDTPRELEALVLRCLEKDRERRFSSVAELSRALLPFGTSESRSIVLRISRLLGESERTFAPAEEAAPRSKTMLQPRPPAVAAVSQTNGSFARTGAERAAWYQRSTVQVGMGLVAVALGVVGWLVAGSHPGDAPESFRPLPAAGAAAAQGSHSAAASSAAASHPAPAQAPASAAHPPTEATPAVRLAPAAATSSAGDDPPSRAAERASSAQVAGDSSGAKPHTKSQRARTGKTSARTPAAAEPSARPPEPAARPAATQPAARPKSNAALDELFGDTK